MPRDLAYAIARALRSTAGHSNASPVGAVAVADCADQGESLNAFQIACEIAWPTVKLRNTYTVARRAIQLAGVARLRETVDRDRRYRP